MPVLRFPRNFKPIKTAGAELSPIISRWRQDLKENKNQAAWSEMKARREVGAGMQWGVPYLWVQHNKEGHCSCTRDPSSRWGLRGQLLPGFSGMRLMASPTSCRQRNYPPSVGTRSVQSFGLGPFPTFGLTPSSRNWSQNRAAPRGLWSITSHRFWFSCFSFSEEEPITPAARDLLRSSAAQRRLCYILLPTGIGCSSKCLLYFPYVSACHNAESCPSNSSLKSASYFFLTVARNSWKTSVLRS